ncbi:MAG: hypothetical protein AAFY29_19260 [Pseudomonadota bacterium]
MIVREVKPGCESRYADISKGISAAAARFPGFVSAHHSPPANGDAHHVTVLQFDSMASLRDWEESPERQLWLGRVEEVAYPAKVAKHINTGLESLFAAKGSALVPVRPKRYKMAIVLTLVIYGLLVSLRPILSDLLFGLPEYLAGFVLVTTQVLIMTYLIMPLVTRALSGWLYR